MTWSWAGIKALASIGTIYTFSKSGCGDAEVEHKRNDLAERKLQEAKDKCNEDRMKRLAFINIGLHQYNEAKAYITNTDVAMLKYY